MNSILHYDKIDVNEISLSNLNITSDENIYNSFIRLKDKKLIVQVNNLIINYFKYIYFLQIY